MPPSSPVPDAPVPADPGAALSEAWPEALLLDDPRFDAHAAGAYHPERPERLTAARHATDGAKVRWQAVPAREATEEELVRVHEPRFIEQLDALRGRRGQLDADTYVSPQSIAAARLAAGGLVDLVDLLLDEEAPRELRRGVALLRPPGHHARPSRAMGFCLLNNVAVAAAHAVARGLERVLVLDWDVHHGNGTQEIFWNDPRVLYMSTHQFPFYPGTGDATERGEGDGTGYTVNVPLTAHGGDAVYRSAFERVLLPVAEEYRPQLVLVSAGFDASARDPLAQMELTAAAFHWMTRALVGVADRSAGGRIALVLEGGYDLVALESGLAQSIAALTSASAAPELPRAPDDADITRAATAAALHWPQALK